MYQQPPLRYWAECPACRAKAAPGAYQCARCGRSLILTPADELALAVAGQRPRRGAVSGCASALAGLILLGIGLLLLLFAPILGVLFFGALVLIALVRLALR